MSEFINQTMLLSFPVVGCVLFVSGLLVRRHLKRNVANYVHTHGMVVSHQKCTIAGDGPVYRPLVEIKAGNSVYSVEGSVGSSSKKEEGSTKEVMYDPAFPATAVIVSDYYFAANMLIILGGIFLLFGSLLAFVLWDAPSVSSGKPVD